MDLFKSARNIFGWNTLVVITLACISTYVCIQMSWEVDFPLTIIGIAVVFPIVFSIGGAYNRREKALNYYGTMKGLSRTMYFASRDWLRDSGEQAEKNKAEFKSELYEILATTRAFFMTNDKDKQTKEEEKLYGLFSRLSLTIEGLRDRGLSGSEVSRVNSHFTKLVISFESTKHIFQYRTPKTLRTYSKIFIYIIPIIYAPYFAHIATDNALIFGLVMPILFGLIFTSLDNIQGHLENPFDQVGEDDIKINAEKFINSLDL